MNKYISKYNNKNKNKSEIKSKSKSKSESESKKSKTRKEKSEIVIAKSKLYRKRCWTTSKETRKLQAKYWKWFQRKFIDSNILIFFKISNKLKLQ